MAFKYSSAVNGQSMASQWNEKPVEIVRNKVFCLWRQPCKQQQRNERELLAHGRPGNEDQGGCRRA